MNQGGGCGEGAVRVVVYWFCGEVKIRGSGMMENVFSITSVTFGVQNQGNSL